MQLSRWLSHQCAVVGVALLLVRMSPVLASPVAGFLRAANAVPGQYIVVLKGTASPAMARAEVAAFDAEVTSLAVRYHAKVGYRYNAALLGFVAAMTETDAIALSKDPSVAFVEENAMAQTAAVPQSGATWGLDRIDQPALPLNNEFVQLGQGEGATIYVIDTGLRATHQEFSGRVKVGFTAVEDGQGTNDCNQHGTHVAGTAAGTTYGVAKKATIVPVRVLGCDGRGPLDGIVAGIDYVARQATPLAVANLSLSANGFAAIDEAVRGAVAAGVVVVAAAGNNNLDACNYSPSREPMAITVGATTIKDARWPFSNYGTCVDLSAPGVDITSAGITNDAESRLSSGTSMAAPHVAGAVAAYRAANPTASPAQVTAAITAKAFAGTITNVNSSPNLLLNTRFVDATAPTAEITQPLNNTTVATSFTVSATASDTNLVSVQLAVDGAIVETKTAPPFDFQVTGLTAGPHTLTVTSKDIVDQSTIATSTVIVGELDRDNDDESKNSGGCMAGGNASNPLLLLALLALSRRRRSY